MSEMYLKPESSLETLIKCTNATRKIGDEEQKNIKQIIIRLFTSYNVQCEINNVINSINSTIFDIEVFNFNVNFEKIKRMEKTFAMHLKVSYVEIFPSTNCSGVCISVPKKQRDIIGFGHCYKNSDIVNTNNPLEFVLGVDEQNNIIKYNLVDMAHLLIGGATNSGKSVCVHNIISSILCHALPYSVQFLMIDPKQVELSRYSKLPKHFMPTPPIHNVYKAINCLYNVTRVMDDIFNKLKDANCSNIEEYNSTHDIKIQYCVIVIDELAELMLKAKKEIEPLLVRIAQIGRAAGVHIIASTQRPSHDIITGLIKINFPASICFKVRSSVNSRIILDQAGGEKLLGNGDGLLLDGHSTEPVRFQSAYISRAGTEKIIEYINNQL